MLQRSLLYFADPMCSWCWGFSPVVQCIQREFETEIPLKLVLGGLAPTPDSRVMDKETKQTIREHWQHVREMSGQSFDFSFFDRQEFTYCTEPACRALVAARHLKPDSALAFLEHLQRSFYTQNLDITQTSVLAELAEQQGFAPDEFITTFESQEVQEATQRDFLLSRQLQVSGFPTLIAVEGKTGMVITAGYQAKEQVATQLRTWLDEQAQAAPSSH